MFFPAIPLFGSGDARARLWQNDAQAVGHSDPPPLGRSRRLIGI